MTTSYLLLISIEYHGHNVQFPSFFKAQKNLHFLTWSDYLGSRAVWKLPSKPLTLTTSMQCVGLSNWVNGLFHWFVRVCVSSKVESYSVPTMGTDHLLESIDNCTSVIYKGKSNGLRPPVTKRGKCLNPNF